jgi:hypothetical protein
MFFLAFGDHFAKPLFPQMGVKIQAERPDEDKDEFFPSKISVGQKAMQAGENKKQKGQMKEESPRLMRDF